LFILADRTLNAVVQQIGDDQWGLAIPDWLSIGRVSRDGLDLRTLVNYHAYDDIWVPDMVAGRTMAEVGADRWKDEDLLGDDPRGSFARIVDAAVAAAGGLTPEQLSRTAHLSFGDFTVREYFWQITQFRTFRACAGPEEGRLRMVRMAWGSTRSPLPPPGQQRRVAHYVATGIHQPLLHVCWRPCRASERCAMTRCVESMLTTVTVTPIGRGW
jgi:hypothetical protein